MLAAAVTERIPSQFVEDHESTRILRGLLRCMLFCCLGGSGLRFRKARRPQKPHRHRPRKPAAQQIQPVTTTVIVHGEAKDDYLPGAVTAGTLDGATLMETPLSATVVTRDLLNDQVSRLLSDVVKNDASVGDDYVPVGYYGATRFAASRSTWPRASRSMAWPLPASRMCRLKTRNVLKC